MPLSTYTNGEFRSSSLADEPAVALIVPMGAVNPRLAGGTSN